jgi:transposase
MREMQRRYAAWAYERLGERKVQTAEKLGVDFKTLHKWLTAEDERPE